jgi:hypothetical protein
MAVALDDADAVPSPFRVAADPKFEEILLPHDPAVSLEILPRIDTLIHIIYCPYSSFKSGLLLLSFTAVGVCFHSLELVYLDEVARKEKQNYTAKSVCYWPQD